MLSSLLIPFNHEHIGRYWCWTKVSVDPFYVHWEFRQGAMLWTTSRWSSRVTGYLSAFWCLLMILTYSYQCLYFTLICLNSVSRDALSFSVALVTALHVTRDVDELLDVVTTSVPLAVTQVTHSSLAIKAVRDVGRSETQLLGTLSYDCNQRKLRCLFKCLNSSSVQ